MIPHTRLASDRHGHSLIELVTVLVLIMVIASIATPSMNSFVAQAKTRRALDRVASDIAYARMAAVRNGAPILVTFSTGSVYTIELQSTPPSVLKRVSLTQDYNGVSLKAPTSDGKLLFDARGLLTTTGTGPLVISLREAADSAVIATTGRVYRGY